MRRVGTAGCNSRVQQPGAGRRLALLLSCDHRELEDTPGCTGLHRPEGCTTRHEYTCPAPPTVRVCRLVSQLLYCHEKK